MQNIICAIMEHKEPLWHADRSNHIKHNTVFNTFVIHRPTTKPECSEVELGRCFCSIINNGVSYCSKYLLNYGVNLSCVTEQDSIEKYTLVTIVRDTFFRFFFKIQKT